LRRDATISLLTAEEFGRNVMAWTTPIIVEICAGFEVTAYAAAEI
jgi:coenzyme PQQ precursor peptide PqqA